MVDCVTVNNSGVNVNYNHHACASHVQLKAREAEDALRAKEELSGCRPDGGPPKPPPPGGGSGSGGGAGVSAVAATVAKAAVNVVDLPPMPPPPSYSSAAANPLLLNELTSSPPALNDRTPVSEIKITEICVF